MGIWRFCSLHLYPIHLFTHSPIHPPPRNALLRTSAEAFRFIWVPALGDGLASAFPDGFQVRVGLQCSLRNRLIEISAHGSDAADRLLVVVDAARADDRNEA